MAKSETSSEKDAAVSTPNDEPQPRRRRRSRGYRGYPNNAGAGDVHWGSGFAGIGSTAATSSNSGILTERTRDDAAKADDEDDTLDQ